MINKEKQKKTLSSKSQDAIRLQHKAKKNRKERKERYLKELFEKKTSRKSQI